jgi:hypothetical protein
VVHDKAANELPNGKATPVGQALQGGRLLPRQKDRYLRNLAIVKENVGSPASTRSQEARHFFHGYDEDVTTISCSIHLQHCLLSRGLLVSGRLIATHREGIGTHADVNAVIDALYTLDPCDRRQGNLIGIEAGQAAAQDHYSSLEIAG